MVSWLSWVGLIVACGGGDAGHARDVCDQYVSCASASSEELGVEASALYGRDGSCWDDAADPERCVDECEEKLLDYWRYTAEAECDPTLVGLNAGMSFATFQAVFSDKYCERYLACTTAEGATCSEGTMATAECAIDEEAAEACLFGTYTCNSDTPGFEFVVPPTACADVCVGP